jgi:hypothetical protein
MRREWEPEELIACWTLVDDDWRLVTRTRARALDAVIGHAQSPGAGRLSGMTSGMTGDELFARTEAAVADLLSADKPVTFTAVAAATGVSRATLYRHADLRTPVDRHRTHPTASALEAVAARTRHQEERLRRLERRSNLRQP